MNPKHYHTPIPAGPQRISCPVCHQTVYSRAGIHPQCAMRQAEPPRVSASKQPVAVVAAAVSPDAPVPVIALPVAPAPVVAKKEKVVAAAKPVL
jgi:hypothetical protein